MSQILPINYSICFFSCLTNFHVKCLSCYSISLQLQLKVLQTCKSLFQRQDSSEVNVHFIHALGPEIVRLMEACAPGSTGTGGGGGGARPDSAVVIEASQVLETLLAITAEAHSELVVMFGHTS